MGGRLALLFAKRYPRKVKRLIIISSHLGLQNPSERKKRWKQDKIWAEKLQKEPMETFLNNWYSQSVLQSVGKVKRTRNIFPKEAAKVLLGLSTAKQQNLTEELSSLPQQILFICGSEDEKYSLLYSKIPHLPHIRVLTLSGVGHAPHLETPQLFAKEVLQFLKTG